MSPDDREVGEARRLLPPLLGLTLLALALYWPVSGHAFLHLDDPVYVTHNRFVQGGLTLEGLRWSFNVGHASNWHPLTWMSHMLDVELFGLDPGRHHLSNLLLHTVNGLLLFLLLGRLVARGRAPSLAQSWACAFVAAVFLVHPQRLESVAWVSERKDVLSGLFFMLTLLAYTGYAARRSAARYVTVLVLLALGLMAKPMLVTVPVVLLLIDAWFRIDPSVGRPQWARLLLEKLPLFALSAASSWITLVAQGVGRSLTSLQEASLLDRVANACVAYVAYLRDLFWPTRLAVHYPFPIEGLPLWKVLGAVALLGAVTALAVKWTWRQPWFLLGWSWYLVMMLPVIGVIQVGMQSRADRYTYLPQIGLVVVLCWAFAAVTRARPFGTPARVAIGVIVVAALSLGLRAQLPYWKNDLALFERACELSPRSPAAHLSLAIEYARIGRKEDAIFHDREALRYYPEHPRAHNHLGSLLAARGDYAEGVEHIRTALRLRPEYPMAHYALGTAHMQAGKLSEAIEAFERAIEQNPRLDRAHANLGLTYERHGDLPRALASYERAATLNPSLYEAQLWLGSLRTQVGQAHQAVAPLEAAARLRPDDYRVHWRLALNDLELGDVESARSRQRRLEELSPERAAQLAQRIARIP